MIDGVHKWRWYSYFKIILKSRIIICLLWKPMHLRPIILLIMNWAINMGNVCSWFIHMWIQAPLRILLRKKRIRVRETHSRNCKKVKRNWKGGVVIFEKEIWEHAFEVWWSSCKFLLRHVLLIVLCQPQAQ